jgi:hypothetical protein
MIQHQIHQSEFQSPISNNNDPLTPNVPIIALTGRNEMAYLGGEAIQMSLILS